MMTITHMVLGWKYRTWFFSIPLVLGGIIEAIGYGGRVGSAFEVTFNDYFIMQVTCLVFAPAFFSAALYVTLGNLYTPPHGILISVLSLSEERIPSSNLCTTSIFSPVSTLYPFSFNQLEVVRRPALRKVETTPLGPLTY